MKHSRSALPWKKLLLAILIGSLVYSGYRYLMPRQSADIFVIAPLEYGDTTLSGIVRKDAPVGEDGVYYLATDTGRVIMLDAQGIDPLLGRTVTISGYLTPAESDTQLPFMTVASMETN